MSVLVANAMQVRLGGEERWALGISRCKRYSFRTRNFFFVRMWRMQFQCCGPKTDDRRAALHDYIPCRHIQGWRRCFRLVPSIRIVHGFVSVTDSQKALAANGILRYTFGAVFPLFTLQMYESTLGIHWAGSIFAFASLFLLPIPWVLFRYGHELRAKSHYDTSDL